jgi:hypothetical protein
MKPLTLAAVAVLANLVISSTSHATAPKVEGQDVSSTAPEVQYVVSDRGVHLAAKTRKGSRFVVTVDGLAGPKFDDLLTPTFMWVDPRQYPNGSLGTGSGRHKTDQITPRPVVFSKDGNHNAYVARVGEDWVVYKDGQDMLHLPAPKYGQDFRMEFVGDDARHFLFARAGYPGYELWVDGKQWPGTYISAGAGVDSTDPIISRDGEHIAYLAQIDRDKRTLIVDGKDAGYYGEKLQFTPDGKHLISVAQKPQGTSLQVDGKSLFTVKQLITYYVAPAGNRIASVMVHHYPDGSMGQVLIIDGKPVESTLCKDGIKAFVFSPDGKHYAAVCANAPNLLWVVADGKKGQQYDQVALPVLGTTLPSIGYSPDSSKLVYVAHGGGKNFMIINGEESDDAFDFIGGYLFSFDGKRFAFAGTQTTSGKNNPIFIDGKAERFEKSVSIDNFDFSPEGSRYAYIGPGNYGGGMYIDGKPASLAATDFCFSPDGKHIAVTGFDPAKNINGFWVDGVMVYKGERHPEYLTFSTDSQHVYWCVLEPDKAKPGSYVNVTYADAHPVVRCDNVGQFRQLTIPGGYSMNTTHPGWQPTGQSGLACLGPVEDSVKRFVITPSDTSVATVVANPVK